MPRYSPDEIEYQFLTAPNAHLDARLVTNTDGRQELQLFGNRAGLLSLANVFFWFRSNSFRREFMSLAKLPFLEVAMPLCVNLHLTLGNRTGRDGLLRRTDKNSQLEWEISEDDLERVALNIHRLAMRPEQEYLRLDLAFGDVADIHFCMSDALNWIERSQ